MSSKMQFRENLQKNYGFSIIAIWQLYVNCRTFNVDKTLITSPGFIA